MGKSYPVVWKDLQLPSGQKFSCAICSYANKVRALTFSDDPIRKAMIQTTDFGDDAMCLYNEHCLALDCVYNVSHKEHLLHLLDMTEDEEVDEETSKHFGGAKTMLDCYIAIAKQLSEEYVQSMNAEAE